MIAGISVPRFVHLLGAYLKVDLVLLTTILASQALILIMERLTQLCFHDLPNVGEVPLAVGCLER